MEEGRKKRMSEAIKCDRCGKIEDKEEAALRIDWGRIGKYDLCHDCDLDFYQFLAGNAVRIINNHKESA